MIKNERKQLEVINSAWDDSQFINVIFTDKVIKLKEMISKEFKIDPILQTLYFSKKIMENDKEIQYYISESVVNPLIILRLKQDKEEIVKISIKFLNSLKTLELPSLSWNTEILEIKKIIEKQEGIPNTKQILLYSGDTMLDDRPIFLYTKQKESKFYLLSDDDFDEIKKKYNKPSFLDKTFQKGKIISKGAYGKVYELLLKPGCEQVKAKYYEGYNKFALKIINDDKDSVYMIGLLYGLIHLKKLNYPNIMKIFQVYFDEDGICIMMERLDETLDSFLKVRLQCNALLKVEEIIHIFTQICQGLLYLFKEKMVHMDLKTSNIMRDDNNIWKLIDYDTPVSGLIDQMIGTYQYMSPEYRDFEYDVNQSEELSLEFKMENDVWSLGVILYYMIYLEYPYFSQKKQKNNVNDSIYPIDPDKLFYKGFYISDKGKDLLMSIFQKPQKRIKLKEIMCHAFLNEIHQLNEVNCISKIPMIIRDNPMNLNSVLPTPFSKFNILWHDPNVFNEENKRYLDKYGKLFGITPFTDINQSQEFLSNAEDKWFVITSGTNCKKLIPLIHKNPSLIAIVIFCKTPDYFKELPSKYKKIIKIIHSSFETVLMNIQYYFNYYLCTYIFSSIDSNQCYVLTKMIRKQNEIPSRRDTLDDNNEENNENITVSYDLSTKFSIIINSVLKIKKITNSYDFTKIKEELFELSTFEEIKNMITARLDSKENSFQSIIFLYTCNPIYSSFNACLINDNYEKITEMLTYLFLSVLDKDNVKDKVISPGQVLYKGNKKNKSSDYRNNHTMFWETFSSTTESLNEAENNTNVNNDGTIFEIRLSKNLPHPHLKLLNGWNSFPKVKEVLLWPNFAFHTIAIRKEKWYEYIVLQQDEEYCILQPNLDNLRIWWGNIY